MTRRGALGAIVAFLALAVSVLVPVASASAAVAPKVTSLVLESQTAWIAQGGTFEVRIAAPPPQKEAADDLEYAVSVYPFSPSRSAFTQTLTNHPSTSPLAVVSTPLTDATTDETGAVTLDVGVQDPTQPHDKTRVSLHGAGVYPVSVELRTENGVVLARLLTHLIFVPDPPTGPRLAVGVVVPIDAPIALQPSGRDVLAATDVSAITAVATTLATLPSDGVLLAPSPETVAALDRATAAGDRAAMDALRTIAPTHVVVPSPFVATQAPEADEADRAVSIDRGRNVVTDSLGITGLSDISVIDNPSDDRLQTDLASGRAIVSDKLLQPAAQRVTTAQPVVVRRSNTHATVNALVADSGLAAHLSNSASPVLAAHHLLADLATIYFDNPGLFRSVVVVPPATWRADAAVLAPLLAGLESSPILQAAGPDRLFSLPPKTAARTRIVVNAPTPPALPTGFATLRRSIDSLRAVMADSPRTAQSFADRLTISEAAAFDASERRAYVTGLVDAVNAARHNFQLPKGGSLTLTARRGAIPITVRSTADYPAHVLLQIASDRLKFPGGSTRLMTLSRHDTTQRFTIQSLGSGAFPLRILLKSPDGHVVLSESRLTVRSTNASGVGILLSVGALLFLLVWWYRHARRTRRAGRAAA